jgi:hypothetical protein
MKILATFKPTRHLNNICNYAYLCEIDLLGRKVLRQLKIPSAAFMTKNSFMTNFAQGLTIDYQRNRVYVAYWNFIVIIDYENFDIIDAFSHPFMADLHGISYNNNRLYVTSTAIDALLVFDTNTKELLWRWGPDSKLLLDGKSSNPKYLRNLISRSYLLSKVYNRYISNRLKFKFIDSDFRSTHKTRTLYHHHHLNDVNYSSPDKIILTTKGWNNFENGSIIVLNPITDIAEFLLEPGLAKGIHDCLVVNESVYFTESDAKSVSMIDSTGNYTKLFTEKDQYFIRGICMVEDMFIVGYSTLRNTHLPCKIVTFNSDFSRTINEVYLDKLYPSNIGTAVHTIIPSPNI